MLPYQKKKLKALAEVEQLVTVALAKMNKFPGMYIGDLRDLRDIVRIKLKLEQLQKRIAGGHKWEKRKDERSSTRTPTKTQPDILSIGSWLSYPVPKPRTSR